MHGWILYETARQSLTLNTESNIHSDCLDNDLLTCNHIPFKTQAHYQGNCRGLSFQEQDIRCFSQTGVRDLITGSWLDKSSLQFWESKINKNLGQILSFGITSPIQKVVTLDESSVTNDKVETTFLHRYREKVGNYSVAQVEHLQGLTPK
jgi:hypothetical protein